MRKAYIISLAAMSALVAAMSVSPVGKTGNSIFTVNTSFSASSSTRAEDNAQLLKDASVETSAMSLLEYNGGKAVSHLLFNQEEEQEIINYLHSISLNNPVGKIDDSKLKGSMYGLAIGCKDGTFAGFTWIGGYVFSENGSVYKADIDFDRITKYTWQDKDETSLASFPNMYYIAKRNGEWDKEFLERSKKLKSDGVVLKVKSFDGIKLKVNLKNKTKKTLAYGEYFSLQTKIDKKWYQIPAKESVAFIDIAHIIPAGTKVEKTYDLSPYGELPAGEYRIVAEGRAAKFIIN